MIKLVLFLVVVLALGQVSGLAFIKFANYASLDNATATFIVGNLGANPPQVYGLVYNETSEFIPIEEGSTDFTVVYDNMTTVTTNATVDDGALYYGVFSSNATFVVSQVQPTLPPPPGFAFVSLGHFAPTVGPVNITVDPVAVIPLSFGEFFNNPVSAGTYPVTIDNGNDTLFDESLTFDADTSYVGLVVGDNSTSFPLAVLLETVEAPTVSTTNAFVSVYQPISEALVGPAGLDIVFGFATAPQVSAIPEFTRSDYFNVLSGEQFVTVFTSGTSFGTLLARVPVTVPEGQSSIFPVLGMSGASMVVVPTNVTEPAAGYAHVRFGHLAQAPEVKVVSNGTVIFSLTATGEFTDFVAVPADVELSLMVQTADNDTVLTANLTFGELESFSVVAFGSVDTTLQAAVYQDGYLNSYARVLHANPNVRAVDIVVGEALAPTFSNQEFTDITNYTSLLPIETRIRVFNAGSLVDPFIDLQGVPFAEATQYTAAAIGANREDLAPELFVDDIPTPLSGYSGIRLVHLSPDAPPVAVYINNNGTLTELFSSTAYTNATVYLEVPADTYDLEVVVASDNSSVLNTTETLVDGTVYSVFALGLVANIQVKVTIDENFYPEPLPTPMPTPMPTAATNTPMPTAATNTPMPTPATDTPMPTAATTTGASTTSGAASLAVSALVGVAMFAFSF